MPACRNLISIAQSSPKLGLGNIIKEAGNSKVKSLLETRLFRQESEKGN